MTTFTMQDLNNNAIETPEEKEAFNAMEQALENRKVFDNIQPATKEEFMEQALKQHEQNHAIVQGATGAQYTPIDMKQFEGQAGQANSELLQMILELNQTMQKVLLHIAHSQAKQPVSSSSGDLTEAVGTVLENAEWFNDRLNDTINETVQDKINDNEFDGEIQSAVNFAVENYFSYNFSLEDHCDVYDYVRDAVDDKLEELVQEKLEEILQEKLQSATITFN